MFHLKLGAGVEAFQSAIDAGASPAEAFEAAGEAADPYMPDDIGEMNADMMEAMPPEAMAGMDAPMMEAMPHAMTGMDASMMQMMPPEAMAGMDAPMMEAMPADAMWDGCINDANDATRGNGWDGCAYDGGHAA